MKPITCYINNRQYGKTNYELKEENRKLRSVIYDIRKSLEEFQRIKNKPGISIRDYDLIVEEILRKHGYLK